MVKISIERILGTGKHDGLLHSDKASRTWSSRVSRLPRKTLWSLIVGVLIIQPIIIYRLFFYEHPLPVYPPYNTAETVGLITKWYELLQEMRYLGPNAIAYPPHFGEKAINVTLALEMGLDIRVIETMQQMPYIDDTSGGWMQERDILYREGRFVDYRNDEDVYLSRDPLGHWVIYNAKQTTNTFEQAMMDYDELFPKSAIPLSIVRGGMWGTGDAIVLDTATNRIHVICTQGDGNRDPFFNKFDSWDTTPRQYKTKSLFYGPEIQFVRSTTEVLMDFIVRTAELKEGFVPGGPYTDPIYTPELCPPRWESWVRDLYASSGWPGVTKNWKGTMKQYLFPGHNGFREIPFEQFESEQFEKEMAELRHKITVRYMQDWYTPIPRDEKFIARLEAKGMLNAEQLTYAKSDEKLIPLNLEGNAARYIFGKHWEVYGRGCWHSGTCRDN